MVHNQSGPLCAAILVASSTRRNALAAALADAGVCITDRDHAAVILSDRRHLSESFDVPVIGVLPASGRGAAQALSAGASALLPFPCDADVLHRCLNQAVQRQQAYLHQQQMQRAQKRADDLLNVVIPLGVALAAERDRDSLLERIVLEARRLCNADGGTLYLRTDDDQLAFMILHNGTLGLAMGGTTGLRVPYAPLPLRLANGRANDRYVVVHAALTGTSVTIPDAYAAAGFDLSGTHAFDQKNGYRSTSLLSVPLRDNERVIGVLQLINALDPDTGTVISFDEGHLQMLESLAALASVALAAYIREQQLRQQIASMRIEIDESRRARQVAEITETDYFQNLRERARQLRATTRLEAS